MSFCMFSVCILLQIYHTKRVSFLREHTLTPQSSKPSRQMRRNTRRMDGCSRTFTFRRSPAMWCIMVKMQSFTISSFTLKFSRRRLY